VEVKRERKQALVRVSDSGPGLAPDAMQQALEPFFTTKGREHLGLGLSVAHGIVTRSGGKLTLGKSDLGGLAATFALPLADLRAVRRELRGRDEDEPQVLRNLNILVVDDEPGMRETLALSLETLGHRVVQAVDGRQTLSLLRYHEGFDALVLDLVMPEVDGWEVAYFARKLQPQAAVLLLTGWGESIGERNDGRVDAVLAKPVTMRDLNQAIARTVARRQPNRQPAATAR
jgi:CheY-like chemotaxis protein